MSRQSIRSFVMLVGVLALLGAFLAPSALAEAKPDRYIVVLDDSVDKPGRVAARHSDNRGAKISHVYGHALEGYAGEISPSELKAIRKDPNVAYVEPDYRGGVASQSVPTGIDRTFATANEALAINEENDVAIDANVAVFDTGIAEHPDLNLVEHINCSGQPCAPGGTDGHGHGTHVAGTIAAIDNGFGVVGIAPGARLWGIRVLDNQGFGNLSELIAGIDWVTATREDEDPGNDIEVTNASLRYWNETSSEAFDQALEASIEAGIVHVAAAGNESEPVVYLPGVNPEEITVSAIEDLDGKPGEGNDPLASFSNYGSVVDVAAPGFEILSTVPWGSGYEGGWSGTSMASPHVAGAAAILAGKDRPESKEDVEAIRDTVVEEGNLNWTDTSGDGVKEPLLDVSNEEVFTPKTPTATTFSATEVTAKAAILNARVNPNGLFTVYQFEYGKTTEYGSKVPTSPEEIGSGTKAVDISEEIGGLEPATTYHFRVVATNSGGTSYGGDHTFATLELPEASSKAASTVLASRATLNATINPGGLPTTYQFEYGPTTAYGSSTPIPAASVGTGTSAVEVQRLLTGLTAATTYHYRVVAESEAGTDFGVDMTFTTAESPVWGAQYPSIGSSTDASLDGIDCNSAEQCVAVGSRKDPENKDGRLPMVQRLDGSGWNLETPPTPAGSSWGVLSGVSCPTAESCVATGVYIDDASQDRRPLAMAWDGSKWTLHSVPQPEGASYANLDDVSCVAVNACIAVGIHSENSSSAQPRAAYAARWDGSEWSLLAIPQPEGITEIGPSGVSCLTAEECVAVGSAKVGGTILPATMSWDGAEWSTQMTPLPEGVVLGSLLGVSCVSSEACVAVGVKLELEPSLLASNYAVAWDGSEWAAQPVSLPEGATGGQLRSVSCISFEACVAAGYVEGPGSASPAVQRWDGTEWAQEALPAPGSGYGYLSSVSCTDLDECMAAGTHEYLPLVEILG